MKIKAVNRTGFNYPFTKLPIYKIYLMLKLMICDPLTT